MRKGILITIIILCFSLLIIFRYKNENNNQEQKIIPTLESDNFLINISIEVNSQKEKERFNSSSNAIPVVYLARVTPKNEEDVFKDLKIKISQDDIIEPYLLTSTLMHFGNIVNDGDRGTNIGKDQDSIGIDMRFVTWLDKEKIELDRVEKLLIKDMHISLQWDENNKEEIIYPAAKLDLQIHP